MSSQTLEPWSLDTRADSCVALVQTAMSTGTKDFPLELESASGEQYDASKAIAQAGREFAESGKKAPLPAEVAIQIINAVEKSSSPGKLWLGRQSYVFRYLLPYVPTFVADMILSKLMRVDLVGK